MSVFTFAPIADEHRSGPLPFKRQIDRAGAARTGPVDHALRDREQITLAQADLAIFELDDQFALDHEEDFIGRWMPVPFEAGSHDAHADFMIVRRGQPGIMIGFPDGTAFAKRIDRFRTCASLGSCCHKRSLGIGRRVCQSKAVWPRLAPLMTDWSPEDRAPRPSELSQANKLRLNLTDFKPHSGNEAATERTRGRF